ncbi:MAG TPA: dihydroorotase family protein [Chloroflexota bacterium]|nr:dihydroorotase family protein [Chloroflexota bacterium]
MADFDLIVAGARLVAGDREVAGWLGVRDGRFAAVEVGAPAPGSRAVETLDASGLVALPGLVDCHTHLREPGLEHKEDFATGTAAAAAGGVTTVLVMPFSRPPVAVAADLERRRAIAAEKAVVDFGLQAVAGPDNLAALAGLRRAGATSYELLLADAPAGFAITDDAALLRVLEAVAEVDGLAGVYCESAALAEEARRRLDAGGRRDPPAHTLSRPPAGEAIGVARAGLLARQAGAALHLRQLSTREAVAMTRALKDLGADVTAEVNPHHLFLTADELERQGPYARVHPPLRQLADVEALWSALADGTVDLISTDHAPHTRAEKEAGWQDVWVAPPGVPGLETWLPLLLDTAAAGRLSLPQLARWCGEAPARRFGLGDRKGALRVGADADFVLVDLAAEGILSHDGLYTKAAYTPFHGRRVRGAVRATYVRGRAVARQGRVLRSTGGVFLRPEAR